MRALQLFEHISALHKFNWHPLAQLGKITSDSRLLQPGDVFVACRGVRMDGHDFLAQAIQSKAGAIVFEVPPEGNIPPQVMGVQVEDSHKALALLLRNYHEIPDSKIKLIGVTGTNGKTTIAYLLHSLLREMDRSAYLGTLWYDLPHQKLPSINTTPGAEVLIPLLKDLIQEKVKTCVMEVSSHALAQKRVHGLQFELAIFTQLTQDHLDYHASMEEYFSAKKLLFSGNPRPRHGLVNIDCPYGAKLAQAFPFVKTLSLKNSDADYFIFNYETSFQGSRFQMRYQGREESFQIRLPFLHNIYNVGEVLAGLDLLGYNLQEFKGMLQEIPGIPGRMERVPNTEEYQVFIDYAHTPDAFENVLSQSRLMKPSRIITVFGCGGNRDRGKRPQMGKIAAQYSDIVILTSDNPRSEDPDVIIKDIQKGIARDKSETVITVPDRREAIQRAIHSARVGDVILILGKGHEDYQIMGDVKIEFDDRKVVQECLKGNQRVFLS